MPKPPRCNCCLTPLVRVENSQLCKNCLYDQTQHYPYTQVQCKTMKPAAPASDDPWEAAKFTRCPGTVYITQSSPANIQCTVCVADYSSDQITWTCHYCSEPGRPTTNSVTQHRCNCGTVSTRDTYDLPRHRVGWVCTCGIVHPDRLLRCKECNRLRPNHRTCQDCDVPHFDDEAVCRLCRPNGRLL